MVEKKLTQTITQFERTIIKTVNIANITIFCDRH